MAILFHDTSMLSGIVLLDIAMHIKTDLKWAALDLYTCYFHREPELATKCIRKFTLYMPMKDGLFDRFAAPLS